MTSLLLSTKRQWSTVTSYVKNTNYHFRPGHVRHRFMSSTRLSQVEWFTSTSSTSACKSSAFGLCTLKYKRRQNNQEFEFFLKKKLSAAVLGVILGIAFIGTASCAEDEKNLDTVPPAPATTLFQSDEVFPVEIIRTEQESKQTSSSYWELIYLEIPYFTIAIVAALVASVLGLKIQNLIGTMVDVARSGNLNWQRILPPAIRFGSVVIAHTLFSFVYYSTISIAGEKMAARLRQKIFESVLQQDISFFDTSNTGELLTQLDSDVTEIRRGIQHTISEGIRHTTQIIGGAYSLYTVSPQLTVATIVPVSLMVLTGYLFSKFLRQVSRMAKNARATAMAVSGETIQNIRTVRSFANEQVEALKYKDKDSVNVSESKRFGVLLALFRASTSFAINGVLVGLLGYGSFLVNANAISTGDLTSFLVTALAFFRSLGQITVILGKLSNGVGAYDRICSIITNTPKIPLNGGAILPSIDGKIEFSNVSFAYPSRPGENIFNGLNLMLEEGKILGIVGSSGCGKSTLASLILRFYDPIEGQILLDGINIRTLDPTWLRKNIAIVNQEPSLFHTTILENISYGKQNATTEEIIAAAKLAQCHDFIVSFPDGYATIVGERGVQLSGGQKQRIAIARAILKNPKLLILDEATSALDATSEKQVQSALSVIMKNRTVLVIAHRLSTIKDADQIVVMNNGKIVEKGNHKQLMELDGEYKHLVQKQLQSAFVT